MGENENSTEKCENPVLFGRKELLHGVAEVTFDNVIQVLRDVFPLHCQNATDIDYLYHYVRGKQPILNRTKDVRPEICSKVVENHANEIASFTSSYFLGEPLVYAHRGEREGASDAIGQLNEYMFNCDKAALDKDLASWMSICGVGYRMVLPNPNDDEVPFMIDIADPRKTFVVYSTGFGHRPLLGCRVVCYNKGDTVKVKLCGYTDKYYFEVEDYQLQKWQSHSLGMIPIFEYRLNMTLLGSFEPAIPLLDAINDIQSNRCDGISQFVQAFMKFVNCEVDADTLDSLRKKGAIAIKSSGGLNADVDIVSQELNQSETQTIVDYLYDQVLAICGMPTSTKGGSSTSDTGSAVFYRDGWATCESRAKDAELLFKKAERPFLKLTLKIINDTVGIDLKVSEIDFKFTRRQYDNMLSKTQSLLQMLEAGIHPEVCVAASGLFNDPLDVVKRSAQYLKKWEVRDIPDEVTDDTDEHPGNTVDVGIPKPNAQTKSGNGEYR